MAKERPEEQRVKRERTTFNLPAPLLDQMRSTVDALSGPPTRLTLSAFVIEAVEREIIRLQNRHNAGKPFPTMKGELRRGRPIGL